VRDVIGSIFDNATRSHGRGYLWDTGYHSDNDPNNAYNNHQFFKSAIGLMLRDIVLILRNDVLISHSSSLYCSVFHISGSGDVARFATK
jgi:hypothetical protein